MISIENANMEQALSRLLAKLLRVRDDVGDALYLTPKSAFARLEILEAVAKAALRPSQESDKIHANEQRKADALAAIMTIHSRAKSVIGRRHEVIHNAWGIQTETDKVARMPLLAKDKEQGIDAPIQTLNDLIRDTRAVINDAVYLRDQFSISPPTMTNMAKAPRDKNH